MRVAQHFEQMLAQQHDYMAFYPTRNVILKPEDPIIAIVQTFLESKIKARLTCYEAELQTWPIKSYSKLHVHDKPGRIQGDYNSLLYLNDDFDSGEFYTNTGIIITPKKNRLTFFDGKHTYHGVKPVERNHRYTAIFWWKNTQFYS